MALTTDAVVLEDIHRLACRTLRLPDLRSGQVLVDLSYTGICGSQLLEIDGKRGPDRFLPHTLGHEGSGVVREVGPDVSRVRVGDHVVLSWIKGPGADAGGTVYESDLGAVNSGPLSTFMRRTITTENRLTVIPRDMPLREAALLGCAVPTGAGIVLNTAALQQGQTVAVFGAGGVGLAAVMAAASVPAGEVIAVDVVSTKLDLALRVGATRAIDATQVDPVRAILEITGGRGVDCAVESAGQRSSMESAVKSVRVAGGLCILAGNLAAGETISIDPFDLIRGKRLIGSWGGETAPDRDIPRYVDLYLQQRLKLENLITHEFPFHEIDEAIEIVRAGQAGRVLLRMDP